MTKLNLDVIGAVNDRYSGAARQRQPQVCCPVEYDARYLDAIPKEVIERDYGCGDPSRFLRPGETVLDLGSGTGKICFIASQVVGKTGRVLGVDMNDAMLALARDAVKHVAARIGFLNVEFRKGRIEDLQLDRDAVDVYLRDHPVQSEADYQNMERHLDHLRRNNPLIPDEAVDVVVSNCVLNLVSPSKKRPLFREILRVLKSGGRAVISDIVSDEPVPARLMEDETLWSGCISGAFQEAEFLEAFEQAGFRGVTLARRQEEPWRVVEGIEFRSVTVLAYKPHEGPCLDHHEALIYKGPFKSVTDDEGCTFVRGRRTAVSRKTFELCQNEIYNGQFYPVPPLTPVSESEAKPFSCDAPSPTRHPKTTKGQSYWSSKTSCAGNGGCCEEA